MNHKSDPVIVARRISGRTRANPTISIRRASCKGSHQFSPRGGHTLSIVGSNIFLFAGVDEKGPSNDLFLLRLRRESEHEWSLVEPTGEKPAPRWRHASCQINSTEFIIFGGYTTANHERYNDVWVFNCITLQWRQPVPMSSKSVDGYHAKCCEWPGLPSARGGHACAALGSQVYVFGGHGGERYSRRHLSDVHILSTETWEWNELVPAGKGPKGRSGHKACAVGQLIYVLGGCDNEQHFCDVFVLSTKADAQTWTKLEIELPSPRCYFSGCAVDKNIFIFGGVKAQKPLGDFIDDFICVDATDERSCKVSYPEIDSTSLQPEARSDLGMIFNAKESTLIIVGGFGRRWYGDVLEMDVSAITRLHTSG